MTLKNYRTKWEAHCITLPPSSTTKEYLTNLQRCDLLAWYFETYPQKSRRFRSGELTFDAALEEAGALVRDGQGPLIDEEG